MIRTGLDGRSFSCAQATVATADLSGDQPKPSSDCTTEQAIVTCKPGNIYRNIGVGLPALLVELKDGAELGRSGTLTVTFKSDQTAPLVAKPTISVADDVDLAAGPHHPTTTVKPGDAVEQPIEITNTGTKPVRSAGLQLVVNVNGLVGAPEYSNCAYPSNDNVIFCKFDEELAPGTTYRIAAPVLQVRAKAPAGGDFFYAQFWSTGDDVAEQGDDWYYGTKVTPGTGPVVHLEAVPAKAAVRARTTDSNTVNNVEFGYVQTPSAPHPSGSSSSTPAPAGATATAGSGTAAGGGVLAITGSNAMLAAGAGLALLLIGGVLFVIARRRRTSFTA
jgi:hypothetical protein